MTNQQGAPEALRLANYLEGMANELALTHYTADMDAAAAELRRLHAENERLAALVEAQQPAPWAAAVEQEPVACVHCGRTDGQHFNGRCLHIMGETRYSPTPQADSTQDEPLQAFDSPRAKALMRAWEEGWAACRDAEYVGEEAQNDAFNSSHTLTLCIAEDQQFTAPQADIQPVPQGETNVQLDTDSNHSAPGQQRDVAGSVALGQPVGNGSDQAAGHTGAQGDKLLIVAERNIRSFLRSAVFKSESDREAALNCVDVLWEAASAPADSVTAPAGGETYHLGACIVEDMLHATVMRKEPGRAGAVTVLLSEQISVEHLQDRDVIVDATPPAQAADSVLEDAARLDWLALAGPTSICVVIDRPNDGEVEVATDDVTGYGKTLREALDAARKQGGA